MFFRPNFPKQVVIEIQKMEHPVKNFQSTPPPRGARGDCFSLMREPFDLFWKIINSCDACSGFLPRFYPCSGIFAENEDPKGLLLTCASTVKRSVKHEWPLIIIHSIHVKNTLHYYFSLEMENGGTRVKNLSLNCESHTHLGVLGKANTKNEHNFGRIVEL